MSELQQEIDALKENNERQKRIENRVKEPLEHIL